MIFPRLVWGDTAATIAALRKEVAWLKGQLARWVSTHQKFSATVAVERAAVQDAHRELDAADAAESRARSAGL